MTGPVLHNLPPPPRPATTGEVREMRRLRAERRTVEDIAFELQRRPQTVGRYVSGVIRGRVDAL